VTQHTPAEASSVKTWRRKAELEPFEVERWAHATTTGSVGRKAVLQYLAARADERGSCFPGQRLIGEATEQGERTVRRHLADMTANGLLCHRSRSREDGRGRSSDRYFLHVDGECSREDCPLLTTDNHPANLAGKSDDQPATGDDQPATGGRRGNSQKNSQSLFGAEQARPPEGSRTSSTLRKPRAPDPVWDAMVDACGLAGTSPTPGERGKWNKAAKELRQADATPEEIRRRAQTYRRRYPQTTITPLALSNNWATLGVESSEPSGVSEAEFRARKAAPWL
jgi:hypothetical protein